MLLTRESSAQTGFPVPDSGDKKFNSRLVAPISLLVASNSEEENHAAPYSDHDHMRRRAFFGAVLRSRQSK
jgi:hypothetical protein